MLHHGRPRRERGLGPRDHHEPRPGGAPDGGVERREREQHQPEVADDQVPGRVAQIVLEVGGERRGGHRQQRERHDHRPRRSDRQGERRQHAVGDRQDHDRERQRDPGDQQGQRPGRGDVGEGADPDVVRDHADPGRQRERRRQERRARPPRRARSRAAVLGASGFARTRRETTGTTAMTASNTAAVPTAIRISRAARPAADPRGVASTTGIEARPVAAAASAPIAGLDEARATAAPVRAASVAGSIPRSPGRPPSSHAIPVSTMALAAHRASTSRR